MITFFLALALPVVSLSAANGGRVSLFAPSPRPRVLFFVTTECPISRKFSPEMVRLHRSFGRRVDFYAVFVDPKLGPAAARKFGREFGLPFPSLLDPKQKAAGTLDLSVVPTGVLLDRTGQPQYVGRIDDRFPRIGIQRKKPTRHDLGLAVDSLLSKKPLAVVRTEPVGCVMPYVGD